MKFQVLLSCMYQNDTSIINESNLNTVSTLVINQTDVLDDKLVNVSDLHTFYNVDSRGLSVSRNIAIETTDADVCLLADDDEVFIEDLENTVLNAYNKLTDADLIVFNISKRPVKLGHTERKLKKYELLKVSSCQISFKLNTIRGRVAFDPNLGAGTGNGASEENLFLLNCHSLGLKIYYQPIEIATLTEKKSTWFDGYNETYFYNRGRTTRYIFGLPLSILYGLYFVIMKRKLYRNYVTTLKAFSMLLKGIRKPIYNKGEPMNS